MAEPFDPDAFLKQEFDPDSFLQEPFDPDGFLATPEPQTAAQSMSRIDAPLPNSPLAPAAPMFTIDQVDQPGRTYVEPSAKDNEHALLDQAFGELKRKGQTKAGTIYNLAQLWSVPSNIIEANLEGFAAAAEKARWQPSAFERESPDLYRLAIRHPSLAPMVVTNKPVSDATKAVRIAMEFGGRYVEPVINWGRELFYGAQEVAGRALNPLLDVARSASLEPTPQAEVEARRARAKALGIKFVEEPELTDAQVAARRAELAADAERRDAPTGDAAAQEAAREARLAEDRRQADPTRRAEELEKNLADRQVLELDDRKARIAREDDSLGGAMIRLKARYEERKRLSDVASLSYGLFYLRPGSPEFIEQQTKIHNLKMEAQPRAFGDNEGWASIATDVVQGAESLITTTEAAGVAGVAGAAVGGAAGLVAQAVTKAPGLAARGAQAGARAGLAIGGAEATFRLEAGSTYDETADWKTDTGEPLTHEARVFIASVVGGINTAVEMVALGKLLETAGPAANLLKVGNMAGLKRLMAVEPSISRKLTDLGRQLLAAQASEVGEEMVQTATGQVAKNYVTKDPESFDANEILESGFKAYWGVLPFSVVGPSIQLAASMRHVDQAAQAPARVAALGTLAENETVKAAPAAFAEMVEKMTAETGQPVSEVYVDAQAVQRFFQEQDEGATRQALEAALGPSGPAQVAEALATGSRLTIPVETVLATWGASEVGRATQGDTALTPVHLTPNELQAQRDEVEAQAQAIAQAELAKAAAAAEAAQLGDGMEAEAVAAGRSKKEAKTLGALWHHFYATQASNAGVSPAEMAQRYRVQIGLGTEEGVAAGALQQPDSTKPTVQPPTAEVLRQRFAGQTTDERVSDFFVDTTTGVLNKRAWERLDPSGRQPAVISIEGVKYLNDALGHEAGNAAYRAAAQALSKHAPEVAKVGGDFAVYVRDAAELEQLLAAANAEAALEGFALTGAVGPSLKEAGAAAGAAKASAEAAGTRAPRGARPLGAVAQEPRAQAAGRVEGTQVSSALRARVAEEFAGNDTGAFDAVFVEPGTGLWTKDAWDRMPRKAFVVSIDLNGIKDFNNLLGEEVTDRIIEMFGKKIADLGGSRFDATHVSGDEYLAQSDDQVALEGWLADVDQAMRSVVVEQHISEEQRDQLNLSEEASNTVEIHGLVFGRGVGKTVDDADRALNDDKERLTRQGDRGTEATKGRIRYLAATERGGVQTGRAQADTDALAGRDGDLLRPGEAEAARGGTGQTEGSEAGQDGPGAPGDRRGARQPVVDDPFDTATSEARPPSQSTHSPEALTAARTKMVAAMRKPARQAWATAFLDFVEGWDAGAQRPAPLSDSEGSKLAPERLMAQIERALAERYGIVDPEVGFRFDEAGRSTERPGPRGRKKTQEQPLQLVRHREGAGDTTALEKMLDGKKPKRLKQEEENTLLVQHNISVAGLKHALKMGGLAAPSLAVANKKAPLSGFGDITLIGDSSLVDPKKGTPTFNSDVYSPRYPEVRYELRTGKKGAQALVADLKPFAKWVGEYVEDLDQQLEREGPAILSEKRFKASFEAMWLASVNHEAMKKARGAKQVAKAVDEQGRDDFDAWAQSEVQSVIKREVISTDSGRRIPHTLENVLKQLTKKIRQGEDFHYGLGTARANGAKKFSSLEQIKKAREKVVSRAEFDEVKEENDKRFAALVDELLPSKEERTALDGHASVSHRVAEAIGESYRRGRSLEGELGKYGIKNVPATVLEKAEDFAADLLAMPTEYFEAKPQRIVALGEFRAAVVPADAPVEVVQALKDAGLEVQTYADERTKKTEEEIEEQVDESNIEDSDLDDEVKETLLADIKLGQKIEEGKAKRTTDRRQEAVRDLAAKLGLLFQEGEEDAPQKKVKGWVDLPETKAAERAIKIFLTPDADKSTLFHESAHGFLDIVQHAGTQPGATEASRQEWERARAWLGIEEGQSPTREQHEKWARTFEAYLLEGKAPTQELVGVFERMKLWLVGIYRTLRGVPGAALNDEARAIFDRLLATEEELQAHMAKRGPGLDMEALRAKGVVTATEFEQALTDAESLTMASRKLELAVLKERLRETESWWKEELAAQEELATAAYEALPARRAQRILLGEAPELVLPGVTDEEGERVELEHQPIVLDRAHVKAVLGTTRAAGIRTAEDGVSPDDVAALSGFKTGADMLRSVVDLPAKEGWVRRQADEAMAQRYPSILDDRARMQRMVADGAHDAVEKRTLHEWRLLTSKAGGRQPAVEAIKRAAELLVEKRVVRELRPGRALAAERKAAGEKARAAAKGEWAAAADAARRELLNAYLYRELLAAQEEVEKLEDVAAAARKTSARARAGKASPAYRDALDYLQAAFGFTDDEAALELGTASLDAAVAQLEADGQTVGEWREALEPALGKEHRDLTVAESRKLAEAFAQLKAAATNRLTALVEGKRVDKEKLVEQLVAEAESVLPRKKAPGTSTSDTLRERAGRWWAGVDGFLSNPIDLVRDLTGDNPDSAWWKAIVAPIRAGKHREAEVLNTVLKPLVEALEKMPKEMRKRLTEAVDGAALFPSHTDVIQPPRQRHELLVLALNAGNEGNLQRLTDGRRITEGEVHAAMSTLTREELGWVQAVWDAAETLRDAAFDLEERDSGLRPHAVEAKAFTLPNGVLMRGGYFPAIYEKASSRVGETQAADALASILDPTYTRPGTPHSHTKGRAQQVEAVISLNTANIYRHFAQVAHDLGFREALKSVGGLILNPDVDRTLKERLGNERAAHFLQWLKDVGQANAKSAVGLDQAINVARGLLAPALLGWRPAVALGDFANLATAVASTPLTSKRLAGGLAEFTRSPNSSRAFALEKSPELRAMADTVAKQFTKAVGELTKSGPLERGLLGWWRENAFFFMETVSKATATPVWLGAYRQALSEGHEDAAAVAFADDILNRVFPSHSPVEQAAILRDKGFWGRITVFYGYLSVAYRAQRHLLSPLFTQEFQEAESRERVKTVAGVAGRLLGFWVAYQVLGEFLMGRGPDDGDRDNEEPDDELLRWRNWMGRKLLIAPLATLPIDAASALEAKLQGRTPSPRSSPLTTVVEQIGRGMERALNDDKEAVDRVQGLLRVLGVVIPTKPIEVQGRYLYDVATSAREVDSPFDVLGGLLYGERDDQPLNPATAVEETLSPR